MMRGRYSRPRESDHDNGKPVARRGRKVMGLIVRSPGYRMILFDCEVKIWSTTRFHSTLN